MKALKEALKMGADGAVIPAKVSNPARLTEFRKETNIAASYKEIDGEGVVVFWRQHRDQLKNNKGEK